MSKRESISRYNLIIKKLRNKPASFKEINEYLKQESDIQSYNFVVSLRTFQRDLEDIRSIYNINIQYDFSGKEYFMATNEHQPEITERILEAFDTFNALSISDRLSSHIHFNKRRSPGTEHLYGLLHAIKNQQQISFTYEKFYDGDISQRTTEPYALKEYRHRWYLMAFDLRDKTIKSFALDRMSSLDITRRPFQHPQTFDINEHFCHCFGIVGPNNLTLQDVVLELDPLQGKYIKSLPLHESQQIISDTPEELTISLKVYLTYDFIMELLSLGQNVKVIKPKSLIQDICKIYKEALGQYIK